MDSKPGDVFGPVGATGNFVVIRVNARDDQGYYGVAEVEGRIRTALYMAEFEEALHEVIQKLRSRSEIVIHEEVFASLRITGKQSDEPTDEGETPPPAHGKQ